MSEGEPEGEQTGGSSVQGGGISNAVIVAGLGAAGSKPTAEAGGQQGLEQPLLQADGESGGGMEPRDHSSSQEPASHRML